MISTKTALYKAIDHLELLHAGKGDGALFSIPCPAHAELFFHIALASAVQRNRPTCVLSESFSPDLVALHLLCLQARVSLATVAAQPLDEISIARITHASARIAASPLHLHASAASDIAETAWELLPLVSASNIQVIVCERRTAQNLDAWRAELAFLSGTGGVEVHLLASQTPASDRFIPAWRQTA